MSRLDSCMGPDADPEVLRMRKESVRVNRD